jgi:hypothetical protein
MLQLGQLGQACCSPVAAGTDLLHVCLVGTGMFYREVAAGTACEQVCCSWDRYIAGLLQQGQACCSPVAAGTGLLQKVGVGASEAPDVATHAVRLYDSAKCVLD